MSFSQLTVEYKPLRIGFLIREGSIDDLIYAAGINCLLWGGAYNVIIPINDGDNSLADLLIELFVVDFLYVIERTPQINLFIERYPHLKTLGRNNEAIFHENWQTQKKTLNLLNIKNTVDYLLGFEYQIKQWNNKNTYVIMGWEPTDALSNLFAIQFGYFPSLREGDLELEYEQYFSTRLNAERRKIEIGSPMTRPIKEINPIQLTILGLSFYPSQGETCPGIYIGYGNNFDDLLLFWNIRAAGNDVVFLDIHEQERTIPYAQMQLDYANTIQTKYNFLYIYSRAKEEQINEICSKLFSAKQLRWLSKYFDFVNSPIQPIQPYFNTHHVSSYAQKSQNDFRLTFDLPEKKFLIQDRKNTHTESPQLGLMVSGSIENSCQGYTITLPDIPELNRFYSYSIMGDNCSLRVGRYSFTLSIFSHDDTVILYPIKKQNLIEHIFKLIKIKAELSQPGIIANKIIEKIGGLENARVLKIKGVRDLLEKNKSITSVYRNQAVSAISQDFKKHEGLYIESRHAKKLDGNQVFDYLLKKDFFRAGLELTCEECKLKNWLSLKKIDDNWTCEFCGGTSQISTQLKGREWKFRKSGLFAKDNNQEGAIPVLLTLLILKQVLARLNFNYTAAIKLNGVNIDCESDFCVFQESPNNKFEIAVGECKSSHGAITKQDCKNLTSVAVELARINPQVVKTYIVFSKTCDKFTAEEIILFKEVRTTIDVILFTNEELERYDPYWPDNGEESDIPKKHPMSMSDLALNSNHRYLQG